MLTRYVIVKVLVVGQSCILGAPIPKSKKIVIDINIKDFVSLLTYLYIKMTIVFRFI